MCDVEITDEMLRAAVKAMVPNRIQGFSTPHDSPNGLNRTWGAPHYIRDVWLPRGEQEIWRGDSADEMHERCKLERMRIGLTAALTGPGFSQREQTP
jgi:hypothetical protein